MTARLQSDTIGFISLGSIGGGMAANLAKAGFKVVAMDIDTSRTAELAEKGLIIVATPAQVARAAKRVVTMVEMTAQTEGRRRALDGDETKNLEEAR